MKVHRFIGTFNLAPERVTIADAELVHRMGRVLRLQIGEQVTLCDGMGLEAHGVIESMDKKTIVIHVNERAPNTSESLTELTLYLALVKRESFELAVQKITEVGVAEIVPIATERTVKSTLNFERLQVIVREAAEQSGRGRVPIVHEPMSFEDACERAKDGGGEVGFFDVVDSSSLIVSSRVESYGRRDLAAPSDRSRSLTTSDFVRDDRAVFIGPEGGWTDAERTLAKACGFATLNLGPRILRAETAAIVASYLLLV